MIFLVVGILGLLWSVKIKGISFFLFLMLSISSLSAVLVGRQIALTENNFLYTIYTCIILFLLFSCYHSYGHVRSINMDGVILRKLDKVSSFILAPSILVLLINIYIIIRVFPLLISGYIVVNEFKNEGGIDSLNILSSSIPHFLITLTNLFSPLGYLCVSFHFLNLLVGRIKKSFLYLLASLVIPLSGLISLSRSSTISYILTYLGILFIFYPCLTAYLKKRIRKILIFGLGLVVSAMVAITLGKSGEYYSKVSENDALIDENNMPALFSALDYAGQWQELSYKPISHYKDIQLGYGLYNSSGLGIFILKKIYGNDVVASIYDNTLMKNLKHDEWYGFHGITTMLVMDFGLLGALIFALIYHRIVIKMKPKKGEIPIKTLLALPVLLPLCVTFFSGNAYSSVHLDIAVIYFFILWYLIKVKITKNYASPVTN